MTSTHRRFFRAFAIALFAATLGFAGAAHAQGDAGSRADVLFREGRKLAESHMYEEACVKFAESQKLSPGLGTLLNLGDCYENIGKTATALRTFEEVATLAHAQGRVARERVARERSKLLQKRVPRLVLDVDESATDVTVMCDDAVEERDAFGVEAPIDPGQHRISASAPGKRAFSTEVDVADDGTVVHVRIPMLEVDAPDAPVDVTATELSHTRSERPHAHAFGAQRALGIAVGAAGIVATGVGAVFAFSAQSKWTDVRSQCPSDVCANAQARVEGGDARTSADIATGALIGGGAAVVAGLALFFTAPSARERTSVSLPVALRFVPSVFRSGAGAVVEGAF